MTFREELAALPATSDSFSLTIGNDREHVLDARSRQGCVDGDGAGVGVWGVVAGWSLRLSEVIG
jgi:hypothetical protein